METATTQGFTTTFEVSQSPQEAFNAINNVSQWWTANLTGQTHALNDEFEVRFGDIHYSKHKLIELIANQRIVWLTTDANLTFLDNPAEWVGSKIIFDIIKKGDKTQVRFTHEGLAPEWECYDACSVAWGQYMRNSLLGLIMLGKGQPGFPPSEPVAA